MLHPGFQVHEQALVALQQQMGQQRLEQGVGLAGAAASGAGHRAHDQQVDGADAHPQSLGKIGNVGT